MIEQVKSAINTDKSDPTRDEKISIAMNALYEHFSSYPEEELLNLSLQLRIFELEIMLENEFLPLNSEPIYDPNYNGEFPKQITSQDDCERALDFVVHLTRKELSSFSDLKIDSLSKKCIITSGYVEKLCEKFKIDFIHLGINQNLEHSFFHHFTIVRFTFENGQSRNYIVDCTYRQFFTKADSFLKRISVMRGPAKGCSIGAYMMMTDKRREIAEEILTKGYIEATPENIKEYFDAIIFSGRDNDYYKSHGLDYMNPSDCIPDYSIEDYMKILINNKLIDTKSISVAADEILSSPTYITSEDMKKVNEYQENTNRKRRQNDQQL